MRIALSVGGAIVSGMVTAAGIALDAFSVLPNFGWKWLALICFVVFVIIVWKGWSTSEYRARRFENSMPHLVWSENRQYPLYSKYNDPSENIKEGDYLYQAVQLWFKNQPNIATDDSVANDVIATVTFYDRTTKTAMPIPACFIIAEARDYAGNTGTCLEKVERWAPAETWKLQIAIKKKEEESAYGFAKGNDIAARELKRSSYYVKVLLEGTRVIDFTPLWFAITNPGKNSDLTISEKPIREPNLLKEGFQNEW